MKSEQIDIKMIKLQRIFNVQYLRVNEIKLLKNEKKIILTVSLLVR
jgi:hypothetical protein